MVKIYEMVAGKKVRVLGEGENFTKAVADALENGYFTEVEGVDAGDFDKLENYILGANCDYLVEYNDEGVENMSDRDIAQRLIDLNVVDEFIDANEGYLSDYLADFLDRRFMYYDDQWGLLQEFTTPMDLLRGEFTFDDFYEAVMYELVDDYLHDIDELELFIEYIRDNVGNPEGLELLESEGE